jgi:hypothetical protein
MAEIKFIDGEWVTRPSHMSIVRCTSEAADILHKEKHRVSYALGSRFVFLGEICNMDGFCMVVSLADNKTYGPLKISYFEEHNE